MKGRSGRCVLCNVTDHTRKDHCEQCKSLEHKTQAHFVQCRICGKWESFANVEMAKRQRESDEGFTCWDVNEHKRLRDWFNVPASFNNLHAPALPKKPWLLSKNDR